MPVNAISGRQLNELTDSTIERKLTSLLMFGDSSISLPLVNCSSTSSVQPNIWVSSCPSSWSPSSESSLAALLIVRGSRGALSAGAASCDVWSQHLHGGRGHKTYTYAEGAMESSRQVEPSTSEFLGTNDRNSLNASGTRWLVLSWNGVGKFSCPSVRH